MQELLNDADISGDLPDLLRFVDGHALTTLVPNFAFVGAAVRFHGGHSTLAVVALLLGGTSGGLYAEY